MHFRAQVFLAATLLLTSTLAVSASASNNTPPEAAVVWRSLHELEQRALKDYEFRVRTLAVRRRGDRLFDMSRSPEFRRLGGNCADAAQTLSFMIAGYYEASRRFEVPRSWHHFENRYIERRRSCLAELNIDESEYPLPYWFGS